MCEVGIKAVYRWIHEGILEATRSPGRAWAIDRDELMRFLGSYEQRRKCNGPLPRVVAGEEVVRGRRRRPRYDGLQKRYGPPVADDEEYMEWRRQEWIKRHARPWPGGGIIVDANIL